MRVAAFTMVYNEPLWARVWARHYSRQVGAENCLVLDHGSDDGSTEGLGVRLERMKRSVLDEDARASMISDCARELLRVYDAVVHSDVDELLIADPRHYRDLRTYAAVAAEVETAVGLDLQHLPDEEPPLEPTRPVGEQRQWTRFSAAMCKPALVRRPVRWTPGFHGCDAPRVFGRVYLVHLRYADLGAGLLRLARSRDLKFARPDANPHQRVPDAAFEEMVRAIAELPKVEGELDVLAAPLMARMEEGWSVGDMQLSLAGGALWRLPAMLREEI
jgi:hypothetical protein